jgi:hypothetical protein
MTLVVVDSCPPSPEARVRIGLCAGAALQAGQPSLRGEAGAASGAAWHDRDAAERHGPTEHHPVTPLFHETAVTPSRVRPPPRSGWSDGRGCRIPAEVPYRAYRSGPRAVL